MRVLSANVVLVGNKTSRDHSIEFVSGASVTEAKLEAWLEATRSFAPSPEFSKRANARPSIYEEAAADSAPWWRREAFGLTWANEPTKTLALDLPFAKWFSDGTINADVNCVDRRVAAGEGDSLLTTGSVTQNKNHPFATPVKRWLK